MGKQKIKKLFIANRGEIALRIQRAAEKNGIPSVIACSDGDRESYFARNAKELAFVGPAPAAQSYLSIENLISAAKDTGCNAVHPGYGFLSENADFAKAVEDAGLIFVGPTPESISVLGNKSEARKTVTKFNVPCTPGSEAGLSDEELIKEAESIKYPVIVKAVAGGGGRGMRVARDVAELKESLPLARGEAKKNFASEDVFIERYVENPRHIEVQIMGDGEGTVVHYGTRECSVQRRHQKLVEEAPAPNLSKALRDKIHAAAVKAGESVKYRNAGTVEFICSGEEFFFLEINTRIQVEHPVSEEVTGSDLISEQFYVAENSALSKQQKEIAFCGHAIEYRVYAEDPEANFSPSLGKIEAIHRVQYPWLREEYGFDSGDSIGPFYDAMFSKLIVKGRNRAEAIFRSRELFARYRVEGVKSTAPFHRWLLFQQEFVDSKWHVSLLDQSFTKEKLKTVTERESDSAGPKAGYFGSERVERLNYVTKRLGEEFTIELVHGLDKTYVARILDVDGTVAAPGFCRASFSREEAMEGLIYGVLEKRKRSEIFATR